MAIDKRTFKGGMNKDIDQRLIPEDQYRSATNVQNLHGADGTIGVLTPIPGNIKKGATFSFDAGVAVGGSLTLTVDAFVPVWGDVPNTWTFQLDFNLTDGTTAYNPANFTYIVTNSEFNSALSSWPLPSSFSQNEINRMAAAKLIGEKIQQAIAADSTLASHLSVSVNDTSVIMQCELAGYNLSSPVYLDNFTSPAQDPIASNPAAAIGKRTIRYNQVIAEAPLYKCVGAVKDEPTRKIYWLVTQLTGGSELRDYVLEYNEVSDNITIVYSEIQSSNTGALNFPKAKKIHSLDVINSTFLSWTDGTETPKRLNIDKSISGYSYRASNGKKFLDNHSATYSSSEFEFIEFEGSSNGLLNKLTFVGESDFGVDPGDIIYVEQNSGFVYHEYNGYFKVTHVSSDGKKVVVNHDFISSSVTSPGTLWKVISYIEITGLYSYSISPKDKYWPEAYNNTYRHIKEQYINAHKKGPRDRITYQYLDDDTKKKNDLYGHVWQFSYRYVYDDDEVSALAPISKVKIPSHMALNAVTGTSYAQSHHNKIKLTIPSLNDGGTSLQTEATSSTFTDTTPRLHGDNVGIAERLYGWSTNIKGIEVYARQNNDAPFLLIDTVSWYTNLCVTAYVEEGSSRVVTTDGIIGGITVESATETTDPLVLNPVRTNLVPWQDLNVYFYNDGIYPVLDSRNADKLYDWVPHTAATQAVIDNSSIIYANVTDGFDLACQLEASVETKYKSSDDETSPTQPTTIDVSVGPQFAAYVNDTAADYSADDSFGSPNAVKDSSPEGVLGADTTGSYNSSTEYTVDGTLCPGLAQGNALVCWAGQNGDWDSDWEEQFQRLRYIVQLDMSGCPTVTIEGTEYVPMGTVFSSSGQFEWAYQYSSTANHSNNNHRFGIGNDWTNINVSVTNATTTVETFCDNIANAFRDGVSNKHYGNLYGDSDGVHRNVANWRNCEVFDKGTHYDPTGGQGKPAKMLYIYFRATTEGGHNTDLVSSARFWRFSFNHSSVFTDLEDTKSSFKTGAHHDFGIIYGNNRNQTSFVNKSHNTRTYVKFPSERATGTTDALITSPVQTDTLGLPSIKWSISHDPPSWAEWYQWVYAGNTTVKDFLQFTAERVAKNIEDSGDKKIYLNLNSFKGEDYSYKKVDKPLIDYVFGEGDRIRFISNAAGNIEEYIDVPIQEARVYQYHTDETDIDPALRNPLKEFYEDYTSNTEYRQKLSEGYWISFPAPDAAGFRWSDVGANPNGKAGYDKVLFEIYNPKKQVEEGPAYYYGFSDKLAIETDVTSGNRYHVGDELGTDQIIGTDTPVAATGYFEEGDIYLKGRRMVNNRTSAKIVEFGAHMVEGYYANDFIKSDTYNKGRKHTYNQYVKADVRNTTVYYSGPYLASSNVNGLSEFNIIDMPFKEYSIGYGDIERAIEKDSNLILFQRNKVSKIMVQKSLLMGATGDSNVALSDQILSVADPYAGDYGPAYAAESVVKSGSRIYFVDPIRGVMCRLSNDGLTLVSQNGMRSYFINYFRERVNYLDLYEYGGAGKDLYYTHVGGLDPENNEYIYYGELVDDVRAPNFDESKNKLVGFYEDLKKYVSFYTYQPEFMIDLGSNFYTFSGGYIYLHNQDTTKANYNKFYGATESAASSIEVTFNGEPSMVKTYNNISIEGTYPWTPSTFKTENFLATFLTGTGQLHSSTGVHYWVRKEGVYHIPVPLGSKQEFKDYTEKVSLEYEGLSTVTYTNATTLTCTNLTSAEVAAMIATEGKYIIYDGAAPSAPIDVTVSSITDNVLTVSITAGGTFVEGSTYFLARKLSLCAGIEGEKPKGIFATCEFSIKPSDYTYLDTDQDTIELYAINVDMDYSPVSYKNN